MINGAVSPAILFGLFGYPRPRTNCMMHLTAKLAFWSNSPLDPVILRNCPQPLVTTPGLGHLGLECSRNSLESTPNLYSDQRAACYCNSAFYQYLLICSDRNIVYLIEINSIMLVPTSLKHNLPTILFPYWKITRDREGSRLPHYLIVVRCFRAYYS